MKSFHHLICCSGILTLLAVTSCSEGIDGNEVVLPKPKPGDGGSVTERRMAALIRGHSAQKRTQLVWDSRLAKAARSRAHDMGRRAYFSHIDPDGHGPNWYVTKAGYRLPLEWTAFDSANQVESILAGRGTAKGAFELWLKTSKHLSHLLALNRFYQNHDRFGVGHAFVPDSPYLHYWVFITAPREPQ